MKNVRVNREIEYNKNEKKSTIKQQLYMKKKKKRNHPKLFFEKKNGKFNNLNHLNYILSVHPNSLLDLHDLNSDFLW